MKSFASISIALVACAGFPDEAPKTRVVLDNRYAAATSFVVYDAYWLNVSFSGQPVAPGAASDPHDAIPASADNTAYVLVAPGWDPSSAATPTSFVVLRSKAGYALALGDTLRIPIDDTGFDGNCAAQSTLSQADADFITQIVFPSDFNGLQYDAATCTTTQTGDAGAD